MYTLRFTDLGMGQLVSSMMEVQYVTIIVLITPLPLLFVGIGRHITACCKQAVRI